jgi:hypothetical protein
MDEKLEKIERHYWHIFEHLKPAELRATNVSHDPWPAQRVEPSSSKKDRNTFLGFYSREGMELVLEQYGLAGQLQKKNVGDLSVTIGRIEGRYDVLRVNSSKSPHSLIEMVAHVAPLSPNVQKLVSTGDRSFLHVKWLRMQNTLIETPPDKLLLPGQSFPSLGIGREMMVLIMLMCVRLNLDGVLELPERLHNAALYFRRFRFIDPEMQGILTAILRDTVDRNLGDLAWGMEAGLLTHVESGKTFRWIPREQVLARTGPVLEFLESEEYRTRAREAMERNHFSLSRGDLAQELAMTHAAGSRTENPFPIKIK